MWPLVDRLERVIVSLLFECAGASRPPRDLTLKETYASCVRLREPGLALEDVALDLREDVEQWIVGKVLAGPGGVFKTNTLDSFGGLHVDEVINVWARNPELVRAHLLDTLASLEVERDQFFYDRGQTPPGSLP